MFNATYKKLAIQEKSGKRIGLFRTLCAIFGGLFIAYLGMTLLVFLIPTEASKSITVPLMINTLIWAISALWISIAPSKWIALLRAIVPSFIFLVAIIIAFLF
jgi:hypothetical protein